MKYAIEFTPKAAEDLIDLPPKFRRQVGKKIDALADNPRPPISKKLRGRDNLYRLRAGVYRIIYRIDDNAVVVVVVRIGHRRAVHRRLPEGDE